MCFCRMRRKKSTQFNPFEAHIAVSDDGNSFPKTVECHIENEDKDIGWAYCSFVGHCFSEAVSITAVKGPIESIEWGRPHSFEGRFKRCINAMFHYQFIDMDIYQ